MVSWNSFKRPGPIGIDLGTRSVKMVQLTGDGTKIVESVRWDLPSEPTDDLEVQCKRWTQALIEAREGRRFRGNDAVVSLGSRELVVQNIRVAKPPTGDLEPLILKEIGERASFPVAETEIRYLEAADVRQGDGVRREVIVLGCKRVLLDRYLQVLTDAGLRPVAVDVGPEGGGDEAGGGQFGGEGGRPVLDARGFAFRRHVDHHRALLFDQ